MGKKWMPITAGVLDVIHGIGGIVLGFLFLILTSWLGSDIIVNEFSASVLILCGVLAIIGGIFAIRRKMWPLACIGAVVSLAPSVPYMYMYIYWWWEYGPDIFSDISNLLGFSGIPAVIAIILTVLSRKRFERK